MKRMVLNLLLGFSILFSASSCVTDAYAQDVVISETGGNVDISLVIRYGTPCYFEGSILYYLYDGWYYYPYLYNNYYYYYRYARPLPYHRFTPGYYDRPYFRYHREHKHHYNHHRGYGSTRSSTFHHHPNGHNPNLNNHHPHNRQGSTFGRQGGTFSQPRPNRSSGGTSRPTPQVRGGSGIQHGNGHFGGRR